MLINILFYLFAATLVGASLGVVLARNSVHSAMFLVLAFFTSSGLWLLMGAEFLAIVLVLVYVGAVMVLFLFVVMMLDVNVEQMREGFTRYAPLGALIALVVTGEIGYVVWYRRLGLETLARVPEIAVDVSNTRSLGGVLYTQYAYPLQLAAVLLLLAIVAAITLTMRQRPNLKKQDISAQVAVGKADRLRIVQVPSEKRQ